MIAHDYSEETSTKPERLGWKERIASVVTADAVGVVSTIATLAGYGYAAYKIGTPMPVEVRDVTPPAIDPETIKFMAGMAVGTAGAYGMIEARHAYHSAHEAAAEQVASAGM
ncbi:hypothetical protein EKI60_03870 [Candidatus Saccharibacteria bacterium]|nr:MAG: hypothetical protein EKI60_03870 [Candidatus Saccharibacteria bacterium]TXG78253.1 MAG: hypothetical protein E6P97_00030 [Patescibacteria group bacterium]